MNKSSKADREMSDLFLSDAAYTSLETIKLLVEEGQTADIYHYLIGIFLFPGALLISIISTIIIKSQPELASFRKLFKQKLILIVFSFTLYVAMWWHLIPIIISCWNLFHQIYSWQEFFNSLFQWNSFQFVVVFGLNFVASLLALKSFKLTPAFEERYQFMKTYAREKYQRPIEELILVNETIRKAPEIMQSLIERTCTAMIANDELDSETINKVIETMKDAYYGTIEAYESDALINDRQINIGKAYFEPKDLPILKEKPEN